MSQDRGESSELTPERILEELQGIANELNDAHDFDYVLQLILKKGRELLDAGHVDLFRVDKQTGDLKGVLTTREGGVPNGHRGLKRGQGLCGWAADRGRAVVVGDVRYDNRFRGDKNVRSELVIPLKIGGGVVGVLNFEDVRENAFSLLQVNLLEGLAVYASVALQRLWDQKVLLSVQAIDKAILDSKLDREETLGVLLREGVKLLEPTKCEIAIYHPQDEVLEIVAAHPSEAVGTRASLDECVSGEAVRKRRVVYYDDVKERPQYFNTGQPELAIESEAVAPLQDGDRVMGVFNVENAYRFSQADLRCLEALAHQAAISLKTAELASEQKRQNLELAALRRIDEAIIDPSFGLNETLSLILEEGLALLGCSHGHLLRQEEQRLIIKARHGEGSDGCEGISVSEGICGEVARTGVSLVIPDVREDPRYFESVECTRSELAVPLKEGGQILGVFDAQSSEVGFFDDTHLRALERLADPIVLAIRNAEQQELILEVGNIISDINSASYISETLDRILDCTLRLLKVANGVILVIDEATGDLVVRVGRGEAKIQLGRSIQRNLILGEVMETRAPMISKCNSLWEERKEDGGPGVPTRGVLAAPLKVKGEPLGVIYLESQDTKFFSTRHQNAIELLAGGAAIALENSKNQQQARRSALWEGIKDYNHELVHWIVNKAVPMRGSAERLKQDLAGLGDILDGLLGPISESGVPSRLQNSPLAQPQALESIDEDLRIILANAVDLVELQSRFKKMSEELDLRPFDIRETIHHAIERQAAGRSFVHFDSRKILPRVIADKNQTIMILENFFKNAIEATAGQALKEIRIDANETSKRDRVLVSIADNGCGIAREHLDKIWDPLFTTKNEGTGIGLAVSYEILKRMGCAVKVSSVLGEGTEFVIDFPVAQLDIKDDSEQDGA